MGKERLWGATVMYVRARCVKTISGEEFAVTAEVDSLKQVGIEKLMAKCSHFAEWVGKWERME